MKVLSITHDVTGIRMTDGSIVRSWSNQSMLAESYAHLYAEAEQLRETIGTIRAVLKRPTSLSAEVEQQSLDIEAALT
jgi:hypothetical protein